MSKLVFDSDRMMQLAGLRGKPRDPDEFDGRPVQGTAHLWQVKTCSGMTLTITTAENDMQQLAVALKLVELTSDVSSVEHTGECLGLFELKDEKTIERLVRLNKLESGRHDNDDLRVALSVSKSPALDKRDVTNASIVEAIKCGLLHNIEFLQLITASDPKTVRNSTLRTALAMLEIDYAEVMKVEGLSIEPDQAGYEAIASSVIDPTHRTWALSALAVLWSRSRSRSECGYHVETAAEGNPFVVSHQDAFSDWRQFQDHVPPPATADSKPSCAETAHDHSHVLRTLDRLPDGTVHDGWGCNGAS